MKQSDLLSVTSILSVLLLALHISQDIVFGFDRGGLNQLLGVAILLVLVCGAVLLRARRSGQVIMLLGGLIAAAMMPMHMRNGLRPEFLEKNGALVFVWTLYVLGVTGAFSVAASGHDTLTFGQTGLSGGGGGQSSTTTEIDENATQFTSPSSTSTIA